MARSSTWQNSAPAQTEIARAAAGLSGGTLSTFERATALALWWFRRRRAHLVVLETGLGGRYDAVNTAHRCLALFTRIEAEHTAMLGGTLAGVAWHKAGIVPPRGMALSVPQSPLARHILQQECERKHAQLGFTDEPLAAAALSRLRERGLLTAAPTPAAQKTCLPGRLEFVTPADGPPLLIDGGHTPAAAQHLRAEIERRPGVAAPGSVRLIAGFLADKDAAAWLRVFDDPRYHITLTAAPGHRAAAPQLLATQCRLQRARVTLTAISPARCGPPASPTQRCWSSAAHCAWLRGRACCWACSLPTNWPRRS